MNSSESVIICHQVLHGYKNGHSMLASSIELYPDSKRTMLTMSDMSGHSMIAGYETYLTGYPLKEQSMYVIARTWYAPEMDRPGCVWTHSLLFSFSDLVKVKNRNILDNVFKRPSTVSDFTGYSSIMNLYEGYNSDYHSIVNVDVIKSLYYQLYNPINFPVALIAKDRLIFEDLILNIWFQQWPRLKRNFSYCTGAINPRIVYGKLLDLQVTPKKENIIKSSSEVVTIEVNSSITEQMKEEWISLAVDDLFHPQYLRNFFVSYGADLKAERKSFKALTEAFLSFNLNVDVKKIIDDIGEKFPSPDEAIILKSDIIRNQVSASRADYNFEELIVAITTTTFYKAYPINSDFFSKGMNILFKDQPNQALSVLTKILNYEVNPIGIQILQSAAQVLTIEYQAIYLKDFRKLLLALVRLKPQLSYHKLFWEVSSAEKIENLDILLSVKEEVEWKKVIQILITENIEFDFELIVNKVDGTIAVVLDILNNAGGIKNNWYYLIRSYQSEVLNWLKSKKVISPALLNLIVSTLNPNSKDIKNYGSKLWTEILSSNKMINSYEYLRLQAFCVAVAFNCNNNDSFELLAMSLENVYSALKNDILNYDSWRYIEIYTKPLSFWNDWDKCKKLLITLVDFFQLNGWSPNFFERIFKDKSTVDKLWSIYRYT